MASNNRDVKLTLSVESLGQENITKLEKSLRDLAKGGGASAQEFTRLADEIVRLGQQNEALQAVKALADGTDTLTRKQGDARAAVEQTTQRLEQLAAATLQAKAAQEQTRQALEDGKQAYVAAGNALRTLKAEYDAAGRNTADYRNSLQTLTEAQNQARLQLVGLREANNQAAQSVTEAAQAQNKAQAEFARATKQYNAATTALDTHNKALRDAGATADALGVNITDLAGAEASLQTAFAGVVTALDRRKAAAAEMAEADRLAAIQAQGMLDLYRRGEQALQAEVLAQRDAAKAIQAYEAAKAQALANEAAWQKEAHDIVEAAEAAQRLKVESERLAEAQRELAAQRAFQKQAEDARQMVRAGEYVRFWEQELQKAESQARETAAAAQKAARDIENAFRTVGVRSVADVRQEIAAVNEAMRMLSSTGAVTGKALAVAMQAAQQRTNALELEIRQLTGTLTTADKATMLLKNSMGQIAAGNVIADAIGAIIGKVKEMGVAFITAISDQEKMRRGLQAIYKDAGLVAQQLSFLRATALTSGVALGSIGQSFMKFAASTQAANIPLETTNRLFAAVTRAAGTLGLSGEEVSGMLEALSQMAGKGTVSLEELRSQLGDRLPGAMSLVANGLGVTEAQLVKLVESGQLAARDLFPALTRSLETMGGEVTGLNSTWQNFKTVLTGIAQDAGEAGWAAILNGALKVLGGTVAATGLGLSVVWEGMRLVGVGAVALAATLRGDAGAWQFFNEQVQVSVDRLTAQADRFNAMLDPAGESAQRLKAVAAGQQSVASATATANTALATQSAVTASTAKSLAYQASVTKILADAQKDVGAKIVAVTIAATEQLAVMEKEYEAADKILKATQVQGDALATLTKLRGNEIATLDQQVKASTADLAAAQDAANAHRSYSETLALQRQALVALAAQEATGLEGRKSEIEAIDKKLVKAKAETEQSVATEKAIRSELAARTLAAAAARDNADKVEVFRQASVSAEAAVLAYGAALVKGYGNQAEFARLQEKAALAAGLYKDALNDLVARQQASNTLEQANIAVKQASLGVQQQALLQMSAAARATGDLTLATQYEIDAKRIQIQVTRLVAEAKKLEADSSIKQAEADEEERKRTDPLNETKRMEIEARLKNAKAKQLEAGASETVIKAIEAEIRALRDRGDQTALGSQGTSRLTSAIRDQATAMDELMMRYKLSADYSEAQIALAEREAAALERVAEAYRKKWNVDKDGFTLGSNGQRMSMSVPTASYILDAAKSQGLSEAQTKTLISQFFGNGQATFDAQSGKDWFSQVNDAISEMRVKNLGSGTETGQPSGVSVPSGDPRVPGISKPVHITIGGRTTRVNVASDADADNLVGLLRQLESDGGRAS